MLDENINSILANFDTFTSYPNKSNNISVGYINNPVINPAIDKAAAIANNSFKKVFISNQVFKCVFQCCFNGFFV